MIHNRDMTAITYPTLAPLLGISSMATKQVLASLAKDYVAQTGQTIQIESVGGVDAAKRVQAGEAFDAVFLGSDAIDKLIASGHVQAGSRVDWVLSPVAIAVRAGAIALDISSEQAVKEAVLSSKTISYSTGPSGVYLTQLFERWDIMEEMKTRLIQAPPGVPVGSLVAKGEVELGFQQLTELLPVQGIHVLGNLPPAIECITTFSAGIPTLASLMAPTSLKAKAVRQFLSFLSSEKTEAAKHSQGMYFLKRNSK